MKARNEQDQLWKSRDGTDEQSKPENGDGAERPEAITMSNKAPVRLADNNDTSVRLVGAAAGVASGVAKLVVGQPFDIIKIRSASIIRFIDNFFIDLLFHSQCSARLQARIKGR